VEQVVERLLRVLAGASFGPVVDQG
jgi:hypothetical protein